MWTISDFARNILRGPTPPRVGINLGGPGERRSSEGTLWVEYPVLTNELPLGFAVTVSEKKVAYFQRHPSAILSGPLPWVACSGARNIESVSLALTAPISPRPEFKPAPYTVRLVFSEPDGLAGPADLRHLPPGREGGGWFRHCQGRGRAVPQRRSRVHGDLGSGRDQDRAKALPGVPSATVLCGIEVIAEKVAQ